MKADTLKPSEIEQISAYLDGELPEIEAQRVADRIEREPAWSAAAAEMKQLDALLDTWRAPRLQRDLTGRILAETRRKRAKPQWLHWTAPLAAAAAIAAAAWLVHLTAPPAGRTISDANTLDGRVTEVVKAVSPEDRFVVENLDLFQDYNVVALATPAPTEAAGGADGKVSVEEQLRLKRKLLMGEPSLLASIRTNRDRWDRTTPHQRDALRQRAYAFRRADSAAQREILAAWEKFLAAGDARQAELRRRAAELQAVLNALPADRKKRLLKMAPTERIKELERIQAEQDR